jgi:hypothetical protein
MRPTAQAINLIPSAEAPILPDSPQSSGAGTGDNQGVWQPQYRGISSFGGTEDLLPCAIRRC